MLENNNNSNNYIIALDLGSSNITMAVGQVRSDGQLRIVDIEIVPSSGIVHGEIKNIEQSSNSILKAKNALEERLQITIESAYTGISGKHLRSASHPFFVYVNDHEGEVSNIDVQKLNDDMKGCQDPDGYKILYYAPQFYVVNGNEYVENPVGLFGKTLATTFNLVLGETSMTARINRVLSKVGLKQQKLFINAIASAEAVVLPDEKEIGVAVIDIGSEVSDVCIYHENSVRHIGVIPIGANSINRDIRAYGILERYVDGLKITHGCAVPDNVIEGKQIRVPGRTPKDPKIISFRNLASIIEARMQDIADFIKAEIKMAGYEGKMTAGLVITGGGVNLTDVDVMLERYLKMDVRIAAPDLNVDDQSYELVADVACSTVVGLLLEACKEEGYVLTSEKDREGFTSKEEPEVGDIPIVPVVEVVRPIARKKTTSSPKSKELFDDPEVVVPPKKEYDDDLLDDDDWVEQEQEQEQEQGQAKKGGRINKKPGFFGRIKERLNKYFDDRVYDDED